MTGSKEVNLGVGSNDPEPVVFPLETIYRGPLIEIPNPNCLILTRGKDQVLMGVEETATGVLEVTSARIDLPLNPGLA